MIHLLQGVRLVSSMSRNGLRRISVQDSPYVQSHTTQEVINFGLGQPSKSLLSIEMFRQAAEHRFQETQDPALLQYGAGKGYLGFRKALAAFLSDAYERPVSPDAIFVTAGNSQAISHAAMTFISMVPENRTKKVFVEAPTYFLAFDLFRELGLAIDSVPVDWANITAGACHVGTSYQLDVLERKLAAGDVPAFVYIVPFYHNPTGTILSPDRQQRLLQLSIQYDFGIISDEPYNLLGFGRTSILSLASNDASDRVISLGSFSKILAPGLRLGWAESSPKLINELASRGPIKSGGGQNPVTAALVHSILENRALAPHIDVLKATFDVRKKAMCDALREYCPDCSFVEPYGGYFVWVRLPSQVSAGELLEISTTKYGVSFTPGSRCFLGGKASQRDGFECVRLSFAFYECEEIREGIQRLAKAIDSIRTSA